MDTLDPGLIKRLQAISLKADGAREVGQLAEAEVAAGILAKQLAKHHLTLEDLKKFAARQNRPQAGKTTFHPEKYGCTYHRVAMAWQQQLGVIVSHAFFCEAISYTGSNIQEFVGFDEDREVAITVFGYLVRTLEVAVDKGYRKEYNRLRNRGRGEERTLDGWRPAFMMGAVSRLRTRFDEMRKEAAQESEVGESTALAIFNARAVEVESKFDELFPNKKDSKKKLRESENMLGWLEGIQFADKIPLSDGLKQGNVEKPKLLS